MMLTDTIDASFGRARVAGRSILLVVVGIVVVMAGRADGGGVEDVGELRIVERVGQSAVLAGDGGVRIVVLQGTAYQIGYAHGKLLTKDVASIVNRVMAVANIADVKAKRGKRGGTLEEIYRRTLPYVPPRYREELAGLADGAGIDRHLVELANIFPEMFHCSGFAVMGKATKGGRVIHGRILDYMTQVGLQDHAVVVVTRSPGCNVTMTAGFAGFIGCVTGMNDKHVAIGEMGMEGAGLWDGVPMAYMLRAALEQCDSLDQVLRLMRRSTRTCEYAYVISDSKGPAAAAVRATVDVLEVLRPGQGHRLLPRPLEDCVLISAGKRYGQLAERIEANYGGIDVPRAIEIMVRPVSMESNLHNAIMLPGELRMCVANAGAVGQERFQACYQTYYGYDMKRCVTIMDQLAKEHAPTRPIRVPLGRRVSTAAR